MRLSDMRRASRSLLALLFSLSASLAIAQGGMGGFGGGQGGQGGSMGDPEEEAARSRRPEDEDDARLWTTRTAVLTPGDRVEYKLVVKAGETVFAAADSDVFDPALAVDDEKGKRLAKNDDRAEGDQSPFLTYRFPKAGTYLLKVLSYRSAAGGRFTVKIRTFTAIDAKIGLEPHPAPMGEPAERLRTVFRVEAKKGKIYDFGRVFATKPGPYPLSFRRVVGPTGVDANDLKTVATPDGTPVVEALADGDFYVEYEGNGSEEFRTDYREVAVVAAKPTDALSLDFAAGEIKIVDLPVKPDLLVRTILTGRGLVQRLTAPPDPNRRNVSRADPTYGNTSAWTWFRRMRDSDDDVVRVFHGTGTARFVIRSNDGAPQKITLTNAETLPAWTPGAAIKERLAIGEAKLYLLTSAKSELTKVSVQATQFLVRLDIFRLNGETTNTLMDRSSNAPSADLYFPNVERFVVRVTCDGYGGSGDFTMRREEPVVTAYTFGSVQTVTMDGTNFQLMSVDLEAGKRYQLLTDETNQNFQIDILDDEGQFIGGQNVSFDNVRVRYFVPTRSGRHRLWLRGDAGTRRFEIKPSVAPKIGG